MSSPDPDRFRNHMKVWCRSEPLRFVLLNEESSLPRQLMFDACEHGVTSQLAELLQVIIAVLLLLPVVVVLMMMMP